MRELKRVILDPLDGRYKLAQGSTRALTASELAGANLGQRPDLLAHRYVYWLLEGTDTLYTSNGTQLVAAVDSAADSLARGIDSPVFVTPGGALVDAVGNPVVVSGGGSTIAQYATHANLPPSPAVGTLGIVITATGIPFINRKVSGVWRYTGSTWVYLGEVPDGYFVDNVTVFFDDADPTKKVKFQLSALSTGVERTMTFPDKSGTVALTDIITVASTAPSSPTVNQLWFQI